MSSIIDSVINYSTNHPDKTALIYDGIEVTYSELVSQAINFASGLKKRKITKNSRIILEADNLIHYICAMLGCQLYGCIAVPVENNISIYRLQDIINATKPRIIFMKNNGEKYEDFLQTDEIFRFPMPKSDAVCNITSTTGTTGKPSLVTHTNQNTVATSENLATGIGITDHTVMFTNIPFELAAGYRRVFAALYSGATVIMSHKFVSKTDLLERYETYQVDHISLVCSDLLALANHTSFLLPDACIVESVAGELPPDVITLFYQKFPNCTLYNVYGTTEAGVLLINNTRNNPDNKCLGTPTKNTTIYLVDENGNDITEPGKYGYIAVSGPMNMQGYYRKKDLTEKVVSGNRLILNDIVYFDSNGYYYFVSRVGDIINIMGHKITPSTIEDAAIGFPGVKDCACISKNNKAKGQIPVLYISVDNESTFRIDTLKDHLASQLEEYCVPDEIIIIDAIPRTFSGKLMRKSLGILYNK